MRTRREPQHTCHGWRRWHSRCYTDRHDVGRPLMTSLRVTFSLLSVIAALSGAALCWHAGAAARGPGALPAAANQTYHATAIVDDERLPIGSLTPAGRVDVEGNVIQNAVGDYRVVRWG